MDMSLGLILGEILIVPPPGTWENPKFSTLGLLSESSVLTPPSLMDS